MSVTVIRPQSQVATILRPQSFNDLMTFASMAAKSALVPKDYQGKPENVMLAVQMGSELGLAPMQALQNIAVINGRPAVWGDAMLGLCRASEVCDDVVETFEGDGDKLTAVCTAKRSGCAPVTARFSVEDAKKASLWGKGGPWQQYPRRMLQMRARGFALRDAFPDVLRGLIAAEEALDIPPAQTDRRIVDVTAEPSPAEEAPRKKTTREWLDELAASLSAAQSRAEVHAIVSRDDVQKAFGALKNGALTELERITQEADDRFPFSDDRQPGEEG